MITTEAQYRSTEAWAAQFDAEAGEREAVRQLLGHARSRRGSTRPGRWPQIRQELTDYRAEQSRAGVAGGEPS